ncbi:MAG: tyrosine-type recombinase/integrase [Roseateles asaccharophilus]|uniref:tyrosine-type recombinase/integrase n=1 Tax=Roseateles asaccharophilus TaxID=582607 RepID=UPI00391DEE11
MAKYLIPSDKTLKAIKPDDERKRINDGEGLYLQLFVKGGSHGWRFAYSLAGRRNILSLGTYPDTGLALARQKADEARRLVAEGQDPSAARREAKAETQRKRQAERLADAGLPPDGSFEAVAREWLTRVHGVKVSAGHADRTRIRLEQDAFPWLGRRPIAEIEAPELLQALRRVEGRGAIETAHRIKDACGQVFRYGIAIGACARNPAADLRDALQPVQTKHHAAIVDPVQVGKLLRDMHDYQGNAVTRAALALSALLLLRPGELRHMEWAWVDLDGGMLTVPAEVMKRKKADKADGPPHLVPLAAQAVAVLRELESLTGAGRFVFPALTSKQRCMSENTVRSALRRLGYGNDDMTAHGFRATARTMIAERLGVPAEVIEAQLAHAVGDALGRAYNRTQFAEQRRAMMQAWADYLDKLRKGADVVPIKGKAA